MVISRTVILMVFFSCIFRFETLLVPSESPKSQDASELKNIFLDDQRDRGNDPFPEFDAQGKELPRKNWPVLPDEVMNLHDDQRRARVRELLHRGAVQSGQDFWFAALIFQHGRDSADYLFAHLLASTAVAKGNRDGLWLTAASLDRYLLSVGKKQIYGTQFELENGKTWIQQNYDKDFLDDNLRAVACVTSYDAQQKQLRAAKQSGQLDSNTGVERCLTP
jgi:hypothetical protein